MLYIQRNIRAICVFYSFLCYGNKSLWSFNDFFLGKSKGAGGGGDDEKSKDKKAGTGSTIKVRIYF
jgi:hypothetical protein